MKIEKLHSWDITPHKATSIQKELASKLQFFPLAKEISLVAGADVSHLRGDPQLFAVVAVFKLPEMELVETVSEMKKATFPYISGFLSFRELPIVLCAFEKLKTIPDVVICDGQGIAHPRRIGLAAHLGLFLNVPTIGCAKTILVGTHDPLPQEKASWKPLIHRGDVVGAALRTKENVKPVYVSPGNEIDLESSLKVIQMCTLKYRLPEPTRRAHQIVNTFRKQSYP